MRRKQMKTYNLRKRQVNKNAEGGDVVSWAPAVEIKATIWQAGGAVQAQQYGEHLSYIKNMEYHGTEELRENDGICVDVEGTDNPDYIIKSINRDADPLVITLEKSHG